MTTTNGKARKSTAAPAAAAPAAEPREQLVEGPTIEPDSPAEPLAPVNLDLDSLDKFDVVPDAVAEEFTFRLKGQVFTMVDPRDIDWKDVLQSIRNPAMFMRYAMPADQQDVFYALGMPAWQLGVLMNRWHKHYKMADPGDLAKLVTG
jgi:hypothetical protein